MAKQKAPRSAPPVIDIGPTLTPDELQASQDGATIQGWLASMGAFFTKATALETQAKYDLAYAKTLAAPLTQAEDERLQTFIRKTASDRKAIETHWAITSLVSKFHKNLVAGRTRGTAPLEEANAIGNRLHNTYAEAERKRAAAEQDQIRREAEQKAQADRDRELAEREAAALKAEQDSPTLSDREELFVSYHCSGFSVVDAARSAGYKNPASAAERLCQSEKVIQAITAKLKAAAIRKQAEAVKEAPLEVGEVATVKAEVSGNGRTTWSAELLDEAALIDAVLSGRYGAPRDLLMINQVKLNEYARSLHELLDRWPGVRSKKNTRVI